MVLLLRCVANFAAALSVSIPGTAAPLSRFAQYSTEA